MARMYGNPGPEAGDQLVYQAFEKLPNDFIVYAQPKLTHKGRDRYPDYVVVYQELGVIVFEVKDWLNIEEINRTEAVIRRRNGQIATETSPVEQARGAAHILENMLIKDAHLQGMGSKLPFPYTYAGILPHLPSFITRSLETEWGEGKVFGRDDLSHDVLQQKIENIPVPFKCKMMDHEVRAACATISPKNKRIDPLTGEFKGIIDQAQEAIAKEPIASPEPKNGQDKLTSQTQLDFGPTPSIDTRGKSIEGEMPDEVVQLKGKTNVRLVRGFAGTGKTDVLVLRADYLHEQHPDLDILVTTFNEPVYRNRLLPELKDLKPKVQVIKFTSLCTQIYRKKFTWRKPQDTAGLVANLALEFPLIEELGKGFIADEFIWMKETDRVTRNQYVKRIREGRGGASGRTLTRNLKNQVLIFSNGIRPGWPNLTLTIGQIFTRKPGKL